MTDYRDGKIHGWNGGECPVHTKDKICVWLADGSVATDFANHLDWTHDTVDGQPRSWCVVAFRVVEKYEEPVTIYLNWYPKHGHYGGVHFTKQSANTEADHLQPFKTIKFVSVAD